MSTPALPALTLTTRSRQLPAAVFLRCVALLLLVAAVAKAYGGWEDRQLTSILWAQVVIELTFVIWLASGIWMRGAWWSALGMFTVFVCVTLFKTFQHTPSCGCLGRAPVSPHWMFFLDLAIVAMFVVGRPYTNATTWRLKTRLILAISILSIGLAAVGLARQNPGVPFSQIKGANSRKIMDSQKGQSRTDDAAAAGRRSFDYVARATSATTWTADLAAAPAGKAVTVLFEISSPNNRILRIRGISVSCSCTSVPDPPQSIPAAGTADVVVNFKVPDHAANFESSILMTTDDPQLPPLKLNIIGASDQPATARQ